jgi:hypothetical protein
MMKIAAMMKGERNSDIFKYHLLLFPQRDFLRVYVALQDGHDLAVETAVILRGPLVQLRF